VAFTEDLDPFFNVDEFAELATCADVSTIAVIFDRAHIEVLGLGGGVGGTEPMALAKASDVAAKSLTRNSTLVVRGVTYYVTDLRPDGTGLTVLVLSTEAL
jgi:hypothetical protein